MMTSQTLKPLFVLILCLGACGRLGDPGGGGDNLPNRGIVPYILDSNDDGDPRILKSGEILYRAPQAWADGDRIVLFIEGLNPDTGVSSIYRTESEGGETGFDTPQLVLSAPEGSSWAGESVGAPSVHCSQTQCLMVVQTSGGFGLADGELKGSFQLHEDPIFDLEMAPGLGSLESPSLIQVENGFALYFEGREDNGSETRLYRTVSGSDLVFGPPQVIWKQASECVGSSDETNCWAIEGVGAPEVRVATNELGDTIFRMFYTGRAPGSSAIGFAASFDGVQWHGFANNPILESDATLDHPSNILVDSRYMLFFLHHQAGTKHGIGRAVNDEGLASETF